METEIFPLSEGVFTIGHDKKFVPFDSSVDTLTERPKGSLLVEIQPFLLRCRGLNILFDTGLGFRLPNGEPQIFTNLNRIGIGPDDIHFVLLSHLHKDHAGGIVLKNEYGHLNLSFPKATYVVHQQEFNFGLQQGSPSYTIEDFEILKQAPQVEWLQGSQGRISENIRFVQDGGHCPYHCSFWVNDGRKQFFFGGDVAPQNKQLKTRYMAKYDYDGKRSMLLREQYAANGKEEHWTFMFYHDVHLPYVEF